MLPPQEQWCHQISVTSACWPKPACSNCTRLLGHESKRYFMTPDQFEQCVKVAAPFVRHSRPDRGNQVNRNDPGLRSRKKVIGIFGGEPLMHPKFPDLVDILCRYVPLPNRGLWTSYDWVNGTSKVWGKYADQVRRLLGPRPTGDVFDPHNGYVNWNMHEEKQKCEHAPVLTAACDMIPDKRKMWDVIANCWVQTEWSAAYALNAHNEPKFYFCEIASAFDRVFDLGTGLDVEPGVWSHHLWFDYDGEGILQPYGPYAKQILSTCFRCGAALKLPGRRDLEMVDDVSRTNMTDLVQIGSPMVNKGQISLVDDGYYGKVERQAQSDTPWEYQKDDRKQQIENFKSVYGHAEWLRSFERK